MNKENYCVICGGETEVQYVSYTFERFGVKFPYNDIKAEVCLNCGEMYYDGKTVNRIYDEIEQKLVKQAA